jgi:hypothetical protein
MIFVAAGTIMSIARFNPYRRNGSVEYSRNAMKVQPTDTKKPALNIMKRAVPTKLSDRCRIIVYSARDEGGSILLSQGKAFPYCDLR